MRKFYLIKKIDYNWLSAKSLGLSIGKGQLMDILYIVMPAYNEEDIIEKIVKKWYPIVNELGEESRLIIADSGSTDKTHAILVALKADFPKLQILSNTQKQHGPKCIALYHYAIQMKADYIFQTDSDGQTNPDEFDAFWKERHTYDIIQGKRLNRQDGKCREFVEHVVCFLLRIYFKVVIPDANAPFRLMKAEVVAKYLYRLPVDYNIPNIMLSVYFTYYKESIRFREISFGQRTTGKNSINLRKIFTIGFRALGDFWNFRREIKNIDSAFR